MSRRQGGAPTGDVVRGAGSAAAKGALLIGLAVIIGVFLLQRIDTGDNGPAEASSTKPTSTTTSTVAKSTTTVPQTPAKTPSQLHIIVLNGGAPAGEAGRTSTTLRQAGYTNQDTANTWTGHSQQGDTVMCKSGLDREATALAVAVGGGAAVAAFPTPAPPYTDNVDCAVIVGA